jgi:hypothetical protein
MIRKTANGYQVVSESGKPLSRDNLSKADAEKRLAQVEFFKLHKDGGKDSKK